MRFAIQCPTCGTEFKVPAEYSGRAVRCRACGNGFAVPELNAPVADPPPAQEETDLSASVIPGAWEPTQQSTRYTCGECGGRFEPDDVYDQNGSVICKTCFRKQAAAAVQAKTASSRPIGDVRAVASRAAAAPVQTASAYSAATNAPSESAAWEPQEVTCAMCQAVVPAESAAEVDGVTLCAGCASLGAASAGTNSSDSTPPRPKPKPSAVSGWLIGGGVAAAIAVVALVVASRSSRDAGAPTTLTQVVQANRVVTPAQTIAPVPPTPKADWEQLNGPKLAELRKQAADLETSGKLTEATLKYQEYFDLAHAAPHPSDALRAQMDEAQNAWEMTRVKIAQAQPAPTSEDPATPPKSVETSPPPPQNTVAQDNRPWDQQHKAEIERLLGQAEAKLVGNNKIAAALAYRQLFDLVGPHLDDIHDAALRQRITSAAVSRGKLLVDLKSAPETVSLTARTLLASGMEALQKQRWQAGLETLSDVQLLYDRHFKMNERLQNADYLTALEGMAVAYLKTRQVPKAGELLDDSQPLGKQAAHSPTRELVINRAITDIIQRTKAARAAKSIKEYIEKHPGDPDETMLNLLGTSIFIAQGHTSGKTFITQCAVFYLQQNELLEKTRPGEKRWGVQWMPAVEADKKMAELKETSAEYEKLAAAQGRAYNNWQDLIEKAKPHGPRGIRYASPAQVSEAESQYNELTAKAKEAQAKIPSPPWLTDLEPVLPVMASTATPRPAEVATATDTNPPAPMQTGTDTATSSPPPATPDPTPPPPAVSSADVEKIAPKPVVQRHCLAFAIDRLRFVTSADVVGSAEQVQMQNSQGQTLSAKVVARQDGLALLEVQSSELPGGTRFLNLAAGFTGGPIKCAAIPEANVFGPQPVLLSGQAAGPPAQGEWFCDLSDHPRLAGSPLLDNQGLVIGLVLNREDPKTHMHAATLAQLRAFLDAQHAAPSAPCANPDPTDVYEVTIDEN